MSQHAVGLVIQSLLTDQYLRERFAEDPLEALAYLHLYAGIELALDEMGAFVRTDPAVWSSSGHVIAAKVH